MSYCFMVIRCTEGNVLPFIESITPLLKELSIDCIFSNETNTPIGYPFIAARLMRKNEYRYLRNHPATAAGTIVNDLLAYVINEKPNTMPHPLVYRVVFKDTFDYLDEQFTKLVGTPDDHKHTWEQTVQHHEEFRRLLRTTKGFGHRYADQISDKELPTVALEFVSDLRVAMDSLNTNLVKFFTNYHQTDGGVKPKLRVEKKADNTWFVSDQYGLTLLVLTLKEEILHLTSQEFVIEHCTTTSRHAVNAIIEGPYDAMLDGKKVEGDFKFVLNVDPAVVKAQAKQFNDFCTANNIDLQMTLISQR